MKKWSSVVRIEPSNAEIVRLWSKQGEKGAKRRWSVGGLVLMINGEDGPGMETDGRVTWCAPRDMDGWTGLDRDRARPGTLRCVQFMQCVGEEDSKTRMGGSSDKGRLIAGAEEAY